MKKLKLPLFFVSLIMMSFVSCSKDDDNPDSNELSGTTWTVLTATEDTEFIGASITFNKNGNVSFSDVEDAWSYAKWSVSNNKLKIILGEGEPDDYIEGSFVINGKNATYTYSWYDYDGEWGGEDTYIMTLVKK